MLRPLDATGRRAAGMSRSGWWGVPSRNTLDRATAMLPRLLYERLDEIGLDLAVLYPTFGLIPMALDDEELRCGDRARVQSVLRRGVRGVLGSVAARSR